MGQDDGTTTVVLRLLSKTHKSRLKVTNTLWRIRGVTNILINIDEQKVVIKGFYDPNLVLKKVEKMKKLVEVWHEEMPEQAVVGADHGGQNVIVLKVPLHCPGCKRRVLAAVCELRGVLKVDTDMGKQRLTVTGYVDPRTLLEKIYTTRKRAEVISVTIFEPVKDAEEQAQTQPQPAPDS